MLKIRAGMYAWGGPGTVRLLKTKYHSPRIDTRSFLSFYDLERLQKAQKVFSLSDVWVTYSWGFSKDTESEDYTFVQQRLKNFATLGLRTHAYIQGFNVVNQEFLKENVFCQDLQGNKIPYSKGRSLTCPSNPHARKIISQRIEQASRRGFDGVFVDNLLFGIPPSFIRQDFAPFFGCYCQHCRERYTKMYKRDIPQFFRSAHEISQYLQFRSSVMKECIAEFSQIAKKYKKYFGANLFDPFQVNSFLYQGYELEKIESYLDYFFIENHFLPSSGRNNSHLIPLLKRSKKPVVVLSYDQGIGFEPEYSQTDYDSIAQESHDLGYVPCYKVSEFTTKNIWHTTNFSSLKPLQFGKVPKKRMNSSQRKSPSLFRKRIYDDAFAWLSNTFLNKILTAYFQSPLFSQLGHFLYKRQLHDWKDFVWEQSL